jgi:uncharacterized protein (DUF433 family)
VLKGYDERRVITWQVSTGPNALLWRASPERLAAHGCFKDTRLPVATVIENLEDLSVDEVMEQFDVTREQINAVLDFVAQSLKTSLPERQPAPVDAHPV